MVLNPYPPWQGVRIGNGVHPDLVDRRSKLKRILIIAMMCNAAYEETMMEKLECK